MTTMFIVNLVASPVVLVASPVVLVASPEIQHFSQQQKSDWVNFNFSLSNHGEKVGEIIKFRK